MVTSVREFLDGKGAAELVVKIDPNGSRRHELREMLNIAPNTLSRRLTEGREAGVIRTEALDAPETGHKYVLTPKGARLRMQLEENDVDDLYEQLERYRGKLDEAIAETVKWTREHGDELADKQRNWSILNYYQTDPEDFQTTTADKSDRDT